MSLTGFQRLRRIEAMKPENIEKKEDVKVEEKAEIKEEIKEQPKEEKKKRK